MCGISGQINFDERAVTPEHIRRMSDALAHRGPDGSGLYCDGPVGLGHRRLSIIDLSEQGKQPMWSNDRTLCITFNGEVYNYREIRKELEEKGFSFQSSTDTEVMVNAIQHWGMEGALPRFIGMFAFAVWDQKKRRMFLCRDRAGVKPLYYHMDGRKLLFASEVKAFLAHPGFQKALNEAGLSQYFVAGYFLGSQTVFRNTFKLLPGHYLTVGLEGKVSVHRYWGLAETSQNSFQGSFEEAVEELEKLLESSIRYRLVSDVPVGLFLSGGIDSSLVSAFVKKRIGADIVNITIGFNEKQYDEVKKAETVSRGLGVEHVVHYISPKEAQDALFDFCNVYDEPFADTSGIPTSILSKLTRRHVKVALSADGGDEQFCGYDSYPGYARTFRRLNRIPWAARYGVSQVIRNAVPYRAVLSAFQRTNGGESLRAQSCARFEKALDLLKVRNFGDLLMVMNEKGWNRSTVGAFLGTGRNEVFAGTVLAEPYTHGNEEEMIGSMMRMDYTAFLRDDILVKVDRASMAASLECRDPMLDHRLAEFSYGLPLHYLYDQSGHKRILKSILRKWVGDDILSAPKRGFVIPLYHWLRGIWKPIVLEYLSRERVKAVGFLNPDKVSREVDAFYRYPGGRGEKVWMMLNFQMWAERWYA